MATLQQNINKAVEDFYSIKTALNNAGLDAEGATAEYADKIDTITNNYYYSEITDDSDIAINNHLDYLTNYTIYGNTYQEFNPTLENPCEPIFVGDKTINLFNPDTVQLGYINTSNGNFTDSNTTKVSDYIQVKANTSYILTFEYEELASTDQRSIATYDSNKTFLSGFTYNIMDTHSYLITTDSVTNFLRISTDINCSNLMLIESLIAPDNFIPYGYEIPIKSIGKNLLKNNCITSSVEGIDVTVNNDGSITLDKTSSAVFTIDINTEFKLNVNKQYKFIYEGDTLPSGVFLSVRQKDSIQVIADLSADKVKNLDNIDQNINGIFRCYIYIPNGVTFDNITIKPMITLVENDNGYEAYKEYITKIYLKEPLCKIDNIMDIYDYQTNTILRKIKKIIFNDASVLSSVVGPNTDGWYYTSYTLNDRKYDPEINTSIYNGFIVDNMDARYISPAYVRWSSASASVFRIYVKDTYINTFEGETIQDKLASFINQHPITIWYPTTNVIEEHLLNCNICKIYTPSKEKYGLLNIQTSLNPSKVVIKYNKSSDLATAISKIEDAMRKNNIDFYNDTIIEYADLIDYSLQNSINLQPDPISPDVPYRDWITLVELPIGTYTIPANAFNGFHNLRNIKINGGLTSIGSYAFYDCTALKEVEIPRAVTRIGEQALGFGTNGKIAEFSIICDHDSAAEEYAVTNNLPFEYYGTYTYNIDSDGYIRLLSYENTSGNTEIFVPANLERRIVKRAEPSTFASLTVTRMTFKRGFVGFINRSDHSSLPSTLEYLYLPNTYNWADNPHDILRDCTELKEIELEQGFYCVNNVFVCDNCPLTQQSLIGMLNALADLTGKTAKTLVIGSTNLAKLSSEQIAIATEKNWILA